MSILTPTTELEAVNEMLATVSEAPVDTLEDATVTDAQSALSILRKTSRTVQAAGWSFNRERRTFAPDGANKIAVPTDVLEIDPVYPSIDAVRVGGFLYDRQNRTFEFTDDVECDVVYVREFEDLPESARQYITTLAAHTFANRVMGDANTHAITLRDVIRARADFWNTEARNADLNVFGGADYVYLRRTRRSWL